MRSSYVIVKIKKSISRSEKTRLIKVVNGTTVSVKGKRYHSRGLLSRLDGLRLCPGVYVFPKDRVRELNEFLRKRRLADSIEVVGLCECIHERR